MKTRKMPCLNNTRMKSNNWDRCLCSSNQVHLPTTTKSKRPWPKSQLLKTRSQTSPQCKMTMKLKPQNRKPFKKTCLLLNLWSSLKWKGTKSNLLQIHRLPPIKRNSLRTKMSLTSHLRSLKTLMKTFLLFNLKSRVRAFKRQRMKKLLPLLSNSSRKMLHSTSKSSSLKNFKKWLLKWRKRCRRALPSPSKLLKNKLNLNQIVRRPSSGKKLAEFNANSLKTRDKTRRKCSSNLLSRLPLRKNFRKWWLNFKQNANSKLLSYKIWLGKETTRNKICFSQSHNKTVI